MDRIRVTVWGENVHDREDGRVQRHYPRGMHETIAQGIRDDLGDRVTTRTATLQEEEHGLTADVLSQTDVLTWWGHAAHAAVSDEIVSRVHDRVLAGMGLLVLHSGHESKIFRRLMGTTCSLRWRDADDRELVWCVAPAHPIASGVPSPFIIPRQEMYGEYFDIPQPEELIFVSSFSGGEVFRSGCCFKRGAGRIFYFSPGHETFPVYHHPSVRQVLANGVLWAAASQPVMDRPFASHNSPAGWFESESVES